MQTALLCTFTDPPPPSEHNKIRAPKPQDNIIDFCDEHVPVYFIIDQMNALDCEGVNMDVVDNQWKVAAQEYLNQLTSGHY
jgi:hypothetical protein